MSGSKAAAGAAVGGKAARACDSCLRRRARWYCAADDAFLCQACDASVHSANPLARRHERLRLRPTSPPVGAASTSTSMPAATKKRRQQQVAPAAWSRRKARTRRPPVKSVGALLSRKLIVVPEVTVESSSSEDLKADEEEEEEQLLYRVPTFDRALAELCSPPPPADDSPAAAASCFREEHAKAVAVAAESPVQQLPDSFAAGFGPTDAELREFAADMEALLGQGLDDGNELDESFYMESLGLMAPQSAEDGGRVVKMETDSSAISHSDEGCFEQKASVSNGGVAPDAPFLKRSLDLRLDYEAVIESWGSSPWTGGHRPDVRLDDFWPHAHHSGVWMAGGGRLLGGEALAPRLGMGGGREARVSRYREKRRTRLFAKKIRYEVRKLNAEKRPRMKGRFVKRPAAAAGGAAAPCAVT
ncbi:unnamed protein product [Urochloa decumbens]|uniref:Uncharacterized protein n=1 Tax=Urochloa decumbens TaxID=240449 RepID=A0ABC9EDY2_9POAL